MALEAGTRIGAYEILGPLGTGGMSEVYRARDLTLGREVALKLLPEDWSRDRDRVARFEREAKLLASLQHPNIGVIHGLERDGTRTFLVLELLSGETLAERLESGPLSLEEARRVFIQIALGLEAAHGKGIIHRDLKPANARITADGTVKLLDFGLGKDVRPPPPRENTATYEKRLTSPGLVMGTPAYMSPEQARGRSVGKTTDIWSFGVSLFEALSGRNPFTRDTLPDTISAILTEEPPWGELPRGVPRGLDLLLRRCLRKDERDRLHDIADARIELEELSTAAEETSRSSVSRWAIPLVVVVLLGGFLFLVRSRNDGTDRPTTVRRFIIDLPATAPLSLASGGALAVSPDGTRLAYSARLGDRTQLYLRTLSQLDAVPIPGTDGAMTPIFSPSGDVLAFFAEGKLRAIALPGGSAIPLADAPTPRGSAWIARGGGSLLFSPTGGGGLHLVPAAGGSSTPVTSLEEARDHRWPASLPDGDAALVTLWRENRFDVALVDLESGNLTPIVENASQPRYLSTGHILFAREKGLYAARFDLRGRRLASEPVRVLENLASDPNTGAAFYDVTNGGDLFYVSAEAFEKAAERGRASAFLVDSRGTARPLGPPRPSIQVPRLSPDGGSLLLTVTEGSATDLWTLDIERGTSTRLTLTGNNGAGLFSPDGRRVAFSSDREGAFSIYWTLADGSGGLERLTRAEHPQFPTSFSPDGNELVFAELHPETSFDLHILSLESGRAQPLVATPFEEAGGVISPDGGYLAYTSTESGREEIYVRRFSSPEGRWQVSSDSGSEPVWSRDGTKLYFRGGSSLMAAEIRREPSFEASKAQILFDAPFDSAGALYANYDVSLDGESFVMVRSEKERTASTIHVVLDWFVELRERAR